MPKNYETPPKNSRAVCQLATWLQASGVRCEPDRSRGGDLSVWPAAGDPVTVRVTITSERPVDGVMDVPAASVTSKSREVALGAFHRVTSATGHGTPVPFDRGESPTLRGDDADPDLTLFRHQDFRRVPNPTKEDFDKYRSVIEATCHIFLRKNRDLCGLLGYELEDLMTYAMVWVCNYLGAYRVLHQPEKNNFKKLSAYITQRFGELQNKLLKQVRSCLPDDATARVGSFGEHYERPGSDFVKTRGEETVDQASRMADPRSLPFWESGDKDADDEPSSEESPGPRTRTASEILEASLANMPHDEMLAVLSSAATNEHLDPAAAKAANARLRRHRRDCRVCKKKDEATLKTSFVPQADRLGDLRTHLTDKLPLKDRTAARHRDYYLHALTVLGLWDGQEITAAGHDLLATPRGSREEKDLVRHQILVSDHLNFLAKFFLKKEDYPINLDKERRLRSQVTNLLVAKGYSKHTAIRRSYTIVTWVEYLASPPGTDQSITSPEIQE